MRPLPALILLCACQPAATSVGPVVVEVRAAEPANVARWVDHADGCPPAESLGVVSDQRASFGRSVPVLVLHDVNASRAHAPPALADAEHARPLTDADARELGVDVSDAPVWLLADGASPSCALRPRGRFVITGVDLWERTPLVVTELEGDCVLGARGRLAVQQAVRPSECLVEHPGPTKGPLVKDPLAPRALYDAYSQAACEPPCDLRSTVDSYVGPDGRRLEWTVITHVHQQPGVDECSWLREDFMGLLSREPGGLVLEHTAYGLDDILVERGQVVGFVDRDNSTLELWDWRSLAQPEVKRTIEFGWTHEEDGEVLSLAPYCGP